jgi:hypothetical protein
MVKSLSANSLHLLEMIHCKWATPVQLSHSLKDKGRMEHKIYKILNLGNNQDQKKKEQPVVFFL